ncbi:MAG: hypothetical protein ABF479_11325 [Gluconacetobacter sp.]
MELINTQNGQFQDSDPSTLTPGTVLTADWCNNIQGEIAAVITDRGGTLDGTKTNQMSSVLTNQLNGYLPLTGGTLTGNLTTNGNVYSSISAENFYFGPSNANRFSLQNDGNAVFYLNETPYASFSSDGGSLPNATTISGSQVASQSWTSDQIAAEAGIRAESDGTLTTNLNAEISRAKDSETVLQNNINSEANLRANADALLAPKASPVFSGQVQMPDGSTTSTPSPGDNSSNVATTAFVDNALSNYTTTANLPLDPSYRIQSGRSNAPGNITFSTAFSDTPVSIVVTPITTHMDLYVSNQSGTGYTVNTVDGQSGPFFWMAIGPK